MSAGSFTRLNQQSTSTILSSNNAIANINNFKLAVVVDVILDANHPYFGLNKTKDTSVPSARIGSKNQQMPINYRDSVSPSGELDFSYIGRVKIRVLGEEIKTSVDKLPWAIPLDNTISQFPLLNEQVMVVKLGENYYYTKPFNRFNYVGMNGDFSTESSNSDTGKSAVPYDEPENKKSYISPPVFNGLYPNGYLGNYFILNPYIRSIRKYEGDTVIESRFGQSIRMGAYDDNRYWDNGSKQVNGKPKNVVGKSYTMPLNNLLKDSKDGGFGNPRLTIRNRQRDIAADTQIDGAHSKLSPKIPPILSAEKNYGGQIDADINNDGSSVDMTSGVTISSWRSTIYKSVFSIQDLNVKTINNLVSNEEQKKFCPPGSTGFTLPILDGDQIVINTDRLILSSRNAETMHFSKKRYAVCTDSEYTVDANDQIVLTTNNLACINSPQIFLGQHSETNEPALLGQTTVDWLYDLCNWLLDHVHWYHHVHPHPHSHVDAGAIDLVNTLDANPDQTQIPVQQVTLQLLRDNLHKTMSRRVYLTGGGYAPGSNGVKPTGSEGECSSPVIINTTNGVGVVGTFKGRNRREGPVQTSFTK